MTDKIDLQSKSSYLYDLVDNLHKEMDLTDKTIEIVAETQKGTSSMAICNINNIRKKIPNYLCISVYGKRKDGIVVGVVIHTLNRYLWVDK